MSIIKSKQTRVIKWKAGDLIGAREAAELCGYKSSMPFRDAKSRQNMKKEFEAVGCTLTDGIWIGGQHRFLRSEIEDFLTKKVEAAQSFESRKAKHLSLVA